jgi:ribonuclease VapC
VLDASAVLAVLNGEAGEAKVRELIPVSAISAVNVGEVLAKLVTKGIPAEQAMAAIAALHLEVLSFDGAHAGMSAEYVRPGISLGDRAFLATARIAGVTGWTSDHKLHHIDSRHMPTLASFR